jgi:hypothetical protein
MGEEFEKKEEKKAEKEKLDLLEPFKLVFEGFLEPVRALGQVSEIVKPGKNVKKDSENDFKEVVRQCGIFGFLQYKLIKNSNGMLGW